MYQFTKKCLIGNVEIDEEHKQLFHITAAVYELTKKEDVKNAEIKSLLLALNKYAEIHFEHEEEYMEQLDDPGLPLQRLAHRAFKKKLESFPAERLEKEDGKAILGELLEYLSRWMYFHTMGSDMLIGKIRPVAGKDSGYAFLSGYRIGVNMLDRQHEALFRQLKEVDRLVNAKYLNDKYGKIVEALERFREQITIHFRDEENYMKRIGYKGLADEQQAHRAFLSQMDEIAMDELCSSQQAYLAELVKYFRDWLIYHILMVDKQITGA